VMLPALHAQMDARLVTPPPAALASQALSKVEQSAFFHPTAKGKQVFPVKVNKLTVLQGAKLAILIPNKIRCASKPTQDMFWLQV
jgi:hypothetical protein